ANYNQMTANKIDIVESACEEYSQEVLGFLNVTDNGIPTPQNDPIVSVTSPTLTPFGDSDFLLFEEANAFLGLEDDPDSPKINPFYYDPEGDILLLEAILNKVELKDLPHHIEYTFLEGDDKLPVIIAKELRSEEKAALIKVLKSPKRAIAWKLSDIQGINPEFCTHKILMEEDYKPTKEVEKLLDAGLIYPISESPWVSPVHCVPKKGGFIMVKNEENELIPTRLVTGWRVCIDYPDFVVVDFKPDPWVPLILGRCFLKTSQALIDVHKGELTLRVGNEAITYNLDQTVELKDLPHHLEYAFLKGDDKLPVIIAKELRRSDARDGFSGYIQIPIDPRDQEKRTFTAHMALLPTVACLSAYAMLRALSKGV
nr:hypothetical protein [Tanacetum cinerariifolium]